LRQWHDSKGRLKENFMANLPDPNSPASAEITIEAR